LLSGDDLSNLMILSSPVPDKGTDQEARLCERWRGWERHSSQPVLSRSHRLGRPWKTRGQTAF